MQKLSRPWFGPYRLVSRDDTDATVTQVYAVGEPVQIHLKWVAHVLLICQLYGPWCKSPDCLLGENAVAVWTNKCGLCI